MICNHVGIVLILHKLINFLRCSIWIIMHEGVSLIE